MTGAAARWLRGAGAALALLLGVTMAAEAAAQRLLVFDVSYQSVWDRVLRVMQDYPVARAADGVIETGRVERSPRPDELGVERVAERITVRVESTAPLVTRITVDVALEGYREGQWGPFEDDGATVRAILDRIRAAQG